jgi:hypothetical protein
MLAEQMAPGVPSAQVFVLAEAVIDFLIGKWGEHKECPFCGASDWQVGRLLQWPLWGSGDETFPAVPVICGNCANTTFINPLAAGLETPPTTPPDSPEE